MQQDRAWKHCMEVHNHMSVLLPLVYQWQRDVLRASCLQSDQECPSRVVGVASSDDQQMVHHRLGTTVLSCATQIPKQVDCRNTLEVVLRALFGFYSNLRPED